VPVDQQGEFESEHLWQHVSAAVARDDQVNSTINFISLHLSFLTKMKSIFVLWLSINVLTYSEVLQLSYISSAEKNRFKSKQRFCPSGFENVVIVSLQ
jgi:hypothetical protein